MFSLPRSIKPADNTTAPLTPDEVSQPETAVVPCPSFCVGIQDKVERGPIDWGGSTP